MMKCQKKNSLYWVHGWGQDTSIFDEIIDHLPTITHIREDFGYFGAPFSADFSSIDTKHCIAIGHSYGLAWLLQRPQKFSSYISLNGFTRLGEAADFPQGIPQRISKRMLCQFEKNPARVMEEFYDRCQSSFSVKSKPQYDRLFQDLEKIFTIDSRKYAPSSIQALSGETDAIVPISLQKTLFKSVNIIPKMGHCIKNNTDFIYQLTAVLRQKFCKITI